MSRATLVYIVMLAVGGGGLWLILRAGAGLAAPADLSGAWNVGGEDVAGARQLGATLFIEQSGRFFRLNFEGGLTVDLKLAEQRRADPSAGRGLEMRMAGGPWSLTALGPGESGPLIFRLTGPEPHTFAVSRRAGEPAVAAVAPAAIPESSTADARPHAP